MRCRSRTRSGCGREAGDVPDLDEQPRGAGRADAMQPQQRCPGRSQQKPVALVCVLAALIDPLQVRDQLGRDPLAGLAATSRGRTPARMVLACAADKNVFAPPGTSSSSRACSWAILRVCSSPRERRRSTSSRSTVSCSSATTGRSPAIRVPTSATECASVASFLRPCPVANTRARADSFGGTSTTRSPSAKSRFAMCRPIPLQPSIAHTRSAHRRTDLSSSPYPSLSVQNRPPPTIASSAFMTSIVTDRLCGSIPITTGPTSPSISFMLSSDLEPGWVVERGGQRYFEQSKPS